MKTTLWKELEDNAAQTIAGGQVIVDGQTISISQSPYYSNDFNGNGRLDETDAAIALATWYDIQVKGSYLKDASKSSLTLIDSYTDPYGGYSYQAYSFKLAVSPKNSQLL